MGRIIWKSSQGILLNFTNKMYIMEKNKQLPPKFSFALKDMAKHFDIFGKTDGFSNLSNTSSNMSFQSFILPEGKDSVPTPKGNVDLMPIHESMARRTTRHPSIKSTHGITKRKLHRNGSNSLPFINSKSSSRSHSSSKSKKYKFRGNGRQSVIRKVKARVMKNAVSSLFVNLWYSLTVEGLE
jgi:hypothetical protein